MSETDDAYLWLEDIDGEPALRWVRERNAEAVARLASGERFATMRAELRKVLDSPERIPWPSWHGGHLYNFWRDAANPRGLWRRTTLAEYRSPAPQWDVLLNLDALADAESENWVWQGPEMLRPAGRRCLICLSRGGSDAGVVREFDLDDRAFTVGGFALPEAKTWVHWMDVDRLFVATDFGPGTLTTSGYPRVVKQWQRGTSLDDASVVFEGEPGDVVVYALRDAMPGYERDFVYRRVDFFRTLVYVRPAAGELVLIDVPDDADVAAHRDWLLIRLRSPWTVGDRIYPDGALLASPFDGFLAGERELTILFDPSPRTSLMSYSRTQHHLILSEMTDVRTRQRVFTAAGGAWTSVPLAVAVSQREEVDVVDTDPDHGDGFLLRSAGFTEPSTLWYGQVGDVAPVRVKQEPELFDTTGLSVAQYFATSPDGTEVPYFVVGAGRPGPTLLMGYGGFEISWPAYYDPIVGGGWLAHGGAYVVANIRGGGEYGPRWHHAALRENRLRAFEDFAAVARDLVQRGITTRDALGIEGGSNGGLLTGVMLTRYPELFGAVVISVPLLDMKRYHVLLAGSSWVAEYGDPDVPADWAFLREYSPYQNVESGRTYPPVLIVTSTRDDRVHPGHARKMAARLCEHGADITYYENIEGGHGGAANNEQTAFMWALRLEFLRGRFGLDSGDVDDEDLDDRDVEEPR
jgi:prolyl oligopeptidase